MSFKKVKQINIVFENCESITIPIKDIYNWGFGKINKHLNGCNNDEMDEFYSTDYAYIIFKDLKNLQYNYEFNEKLKTKKQVIKRIRCKDVTHFNIIYEDGSNDYIGVPWGSHDDFYNAFQELKKTKWEYRKRKDQKYILVFENKWSIKKLFKYWKRQCKKPYWGIRYKIRRIKEYFEYTNKKGVKNHYKEIIRIIRTRV